MCIILTKLSLVAVILSVSTAVAQIQTPPKSVLGEMEALVLSESFQTK